MSERIGKFIARASDLAKQLGRPHGVVPAEALARALNLSQPENEPLYRKLSETGGNVRVLVKE